MSLNLALDSAVSSLRANQESINVLTQNIANANSENYTRQVAQRQALVTAGIASGVQISEVSRQVDEFLLQTARKQVSIVSSAEKKTEIYDQLELFFGDPASGNSFNTYVDGFFGAITELSNNADQVQLRGNVLEQAERLTTYTASLANNLEELRFDVDREIKQEIDGLNNLILELDQVNEAILENRRNNTNLNANFDERDRILDEIVQIVDVRINIDSNGAANVFFNQGELINATEPFFVEYIPAVSKQVFIDSERIDAIEVRGYKRDGSVDMDRAPVTYVSASNDANQVNGINAGRIAALMEMRDTDIPKILDQLDEFAENLQNAFNAIHNDGVGYPPANQLTGTKLIDPNDIYDLSGEWRLTVLNEDGSPVDDPYPTGDALNPLTLNLDTLVSTANGPGQVTMDTIIKEINNYFGPPVPKASVGPLDDIKLASVNDTVNISAATSTMTVTGIPTPGDQITLDDGINPPLTFTFANAPAGPGQIEIKQTFSEQAQEIAKVLNQQSSPPTNIPTYEVSGLTIVATARTSGSNANGSLNIITGAAPTVAGGGLLAGGADATGQITLDIEATNIGKFDNVRLEIQPSPPSAGVTTSLPAPGNVPDPLSSFTQFNLDAGVRARSSDSSGGNNFVFNLPAGANLQEGDRFDIVVPVLVTEVDNTQFPAVTTTYQDTIRYEYIVPGDGEDVRNERYRALSASTDNYFQNDTNEPYIRAELVDSEGRVVADGEPGYLRLTASRARTGIAIAELNSSENGNLTQDVDATSRGLSHFLGLNDFFISDEGKKNSAISLDVRDDYLNNTNKLSLGALSRSKQPSDPDANPLYTYEVGRGSDQTAQRLNDLQRDLVNFDAAGDIPALTTTFSSYTAEITSFTARRVNLATATFSQESALGDAFIKRIEAVGGVNIDEELANTVLFQNNYQASARLITVVDELFAALIDAF